MKKTIIKFLLKKAFWLILLVAIIYINFRFWINTLLNNTYVVRQISWTNRVLGLKGIQEIIERDYAWGGWLIAFDTVVILILSLKLLFRIPKE